MISFTAAQEGEYNFNLQCSVRRKPSPLLLNVKAEGYAISTSLSYTNPEGQEESLPVGQGAKRTIDFGQVVCVSVCVYLCVCCICVYMRAHVHVWVCICIYDPYTG